MVDKETVDKYNGELIFELLLKTEQGYTDGKTRVYKLDDGRYIQETSQSSNPDSEWIEHNDFPDVLQTDHLRILIEMYDNPDMEITVNKVGVDGSELTYKV
jgi:hypothetical protein